VTRSPINVTTFAKASTIQIKQGKLESVPESEPEFAIAFVLASCSDEDMGDDEDAICWVASLGLVWALFVATVVGRLNEERKDGERIEILVERVNIG
jgi:hypothetical protein